MPKATTSTAKTNINNVDIRYRATRKPITCKLHLHFAVLVRDLSKRGGKPDTDNLKKFMGVTPKRWEQLKQGNEPTLAEAAAYAHYMSIEVSDLYKIIPYKTK
jgi:hypothetical protein